MNYNEWIQNPTKITSCADCPFGIKNKKDDKYKCFYDMNNTVPYFCGQAFKMNQKVGLNTESDIKPDFSYGAFVKEQWGDTPY